jgi:hypothetical protein
MTHVIAPRDSLDLVCGPHLSSIDMFIRLTQQLQIIGVFLVYFRSGDFDYVCSLDREFKTRRPVD